MMDIGSIAKHTLFPTFYLVLQFWNLTAVESRSLHYFRFFLKNSANVSHGIIFLGCPLPAFSS